MTTTGKDFPVRSDAFRFSSETRASSAATSPACTECFDIFSPEPGDSDVINQMERLSSKEMKIAARLVWMAVGASCRSATVGMLVSRVGVRNLTLPERWSLSTSPWDLSEKSRILLAAWRRIRFCLLMSKRYRPWKIDEPMLLPATVQEFVDKDHLARFVLNLVVEEIDLEEIERVYRVERGQPPFDPAMMTALLLYGYCNGIYSSRRIAKACRERVDFMSIVGLDPPDFRTISEFRKRHLSALSALFGQVLRLCEQAGLVKLGHVALDGTKIKANASKHKAMSYERMGKRAEELEAEVAVWMDAAAAADAKEDAAFGRDKSGEEMPASSRRQEAARREDPRSQGRTGGRGESRRRGRTQSAGRGGKEAGSRRPQETRKARRPALRRPRPESAEELHRSREPHHEDQGRLHPGLQRAGGGGRRGAGDRRSWPRRQRERPASTDADGRRGRGQHGPQAR